MTSPLSITSIPPEVLGEIFIHASLNDADAPIAIGSVSRTFHRTVRTTPPAWTNLKLKMRESDDDGRCVRKAEFWFAMAGACLVDLSVQMEMESVMEVALSLHAIGTTSGSTSTTPLKENLSAGWLGSSVVLLPDVLHNYAQCIRAFSLHTTNVAAAQVFLSAMYSMPLLHGSIPSYPLQELELRTSSDGTRSPMTPRTRGQATCVTLPRLTNLERLSLVNHPVPLTCLANVDNVRNLRQLKVVCPLRFAPIPVRSLMGVLKAARGLETFELDARLTEELIPPTPSQGTTSFPPTPSTPSFAIALGTPILTPTSATSPAWGHPSDSHHDLITLPFLDYLSLRVNNLPALLNQLLLPSLRTLKIEDLDGNRAGGGQESGLMLRQVFVRMELPCEYKLNEEDEDHQHHPPRFVRSSRGLEVLEMTSVPVCTAVEGRGSSSRSSSRDRDDERRPPSDERVWEWCFRRMRTLRELCISKMDTGAVLGFIIHSLTPSTPATSSEVGISVAEDAVLPRLEKVKIGHCTSFVGPASRGRNANPEGALVKFRVRRPEVEVEWNVVDNLRIRSRQTSAARPGYLELL